MADNEINNLTWTDADVDTGADSITWLSVYWYPPLSRFERVWRYLLRRPAEPVTLSIRDDSPDGFDIDPSEITFSLTKVDDDG